MEELENGMTALPEGPDKTPTQPTRPTMLTVLLVLSFINACLHIFSSIIMFFATPLLAKMIDTGQLKDMIETFYGSMGQGITNDMMASMENMAAINKWYYLILLVLYIGSLIGVIRMLKMNKSGFHIYTIAQICMLIASSLFVYRAQGLSGITSDLLLTIIFILLYYLYFRPTENKKS